MTAMRAWTLLAVVGLLIVVGACSSKSARGTVAGKLLMVGGFRDVQRPTAGVVTIRSSGGTNTTVNVSADGSFKLQVPVGSYSLTGRSPQFDSSRSLCFAKHQVTVREASPVSVDVLCQMM
jgi:hypothetical protein